MITVVLLINIILSFITLWFSYQIRLKETYDKVIFASLCFLFFHSTYVFFMHLLFIDRLWMDFLAPFILMYGPLLFLFTLSIKNDKLTTSQILTHTMPFWVYSIYYLLYVFRIIEPTPENIKFLSKQLILIAPISVIFYCTITFILGKKVILGKFREGVLLLLVGRVLLTFILMIILSIVFTEKMKENTNSIYFLRVMIYTCMLFTIFIIFKYFKTKFKKSNLLKIANSPIFAKNPKYDHSSLNESKLISYEIALTNLMENQKLFLNQDLSLTSLSQALKAPNHHTTQVFSMKIKKSFYNYVNGYRVDFACNLLKTDPILTIEELAEKSGFNSKVSFNRHFKRITNQTPSDFRNSLKKYVHVKNDFFFT